MTTPREFQDSIVSFRQKMGEKEFTAEQRRNGFKQVTLNYLRIKKSDQFIVNLYQSITVEYQRRMTLLGMDI